MPIPSVLIVDPSADTREVLRTVLARRGLRTIEADAADRGLELARIHRPDVIVLNDDAMAAENSQTNEKFAAEASDDRSHLIVLGKIRRDQSLVGGHLINKPYHFAPLIHTIERLAAKAA
jgi:CheY-like chemotaxis protein